MLPTLVLFPPVVPSRRLSGAHIDGRLSSEPGVPPTNGGASTCFLYSSICFCCLRRMNKKPAPASPARTITPTTTPTAIPTELPPDFGAAVAEELELLLALDEPEAEAALAAAAAEFESACCTSLRVKPV
jgi:hypothetical protein